MSTDERDGDQGWVGEVSEAWIITNLHNYATHRCVEMSPKSGLIEMKNPKATEEAPKSFTFDAIYDWNSRQADIYAETVKTLVDDVLQVD